MPKEFNRTQRINEVIQRELADIIHREIKINGMGMITLTKVDVAPDLKNAKIYFTALGNSLTEQTLSKMLNEQTNTLRHHLAQRMTTRTTPRLQFHHDKTLEKALHLSHLLNTINHTKT